MSRAKLHHLAVVVADIQQSAKLYGELLGLRPITPVVHDERQKVYVQFLSGEAMGQVQVELLSPAGEDSPVGQALKKGGGPNHMCFEVADLSEAIQSAQSRGCRVICEPVEAKAMSGQKIAFVFTPDRQIIEFVSSQGSPAEQK